MTNIAPAAIVASGRKRGRPRAIDRAPVREPIHEPVRTETAIAHGRTRKRKANVDQFYVDPRFVPAGWTYEWKRQEVFGQPDTAHIMGLMENGWTPVPADRHEGMFMPPGYRGEIKRGGQVLMERPTELCDEARAEDRALTVAQMRAQKEQLGLVTPEGFSTSHPGVRPQIRTSYERGPAQAKQQIAID